LIIDIDDFKTLNSVLGHDNGDRLLQMVGQRLSECVREAETVARLGGDEFVVVLDGLSKNPHDAANQAETAGARILAVFSSPFQINQAEYRCTASIGATLIHERDISVDDLLQQAGLALYKAKDTGRDCLQFYDPEMQTSIVERATLEKDLRQAIELGQLMVHYQSQVLADGRISGAEALVRWNHPERGIVSPAAFIPLAEKTGLILPLGQWVLNAVCVKLAEWAEQPEIAHLTVAVNVSARQFHHPDFVDQVFSTLRETRANPARLKLELTESMLVENVQEVIEKMLTLKASGISFSLDDFGTGYSSLSYLKLLPLEQLKIDQSFVRDILVDPNDAAIAATIITLAGSLGLQVIAEGVETAEQRDFLADSGCHAYQGYFFSKPLPVREFEKHAHSSEACLAISQPPS
jgi:diguanylate cyclase (GGDEF)-like protein